ncbi:MAG TPA: methyltransferase domain-containing protein [Micromonosporaceae bacterium]|nr:methyltransferase domain-containing protein [Micromonosporaceae bacterium]
MAVPIDVPFSPDLHMRLMLSIDRGQNVQQAVRAAVRPGMRVLDAGTGTGLLAMVALQAGAAEAVGVDRHHIDLAREIAACNGYADRLTLVEADLTALELPGVPLEPKFDLLLALIHTNNPLLDEGRSRLVYELRDRFCADDCTMVPSALRYSATGCDRTDWDLGTELHDVDDTARLLEGVYGVDFQPLVDRVRQGVAMGACRPASATAPQWRSPSTMASLRFPRTAVRMLTETSEFVTFDYSAPRFPGFPGKVELQAVAPGRVSGVIWTQELLYLGHPLWTTEAFSPLATPRMVAPGERLLIETGDEWRGTNVVRCYSQPM